MFFCLPIGSGKSLCYWILPGVFDRLRGLDSYSIVVVVSPLKARMREQVEALKGRGSRAVCVGDALYEELVHDEIQGRYQFLFCSCHSSRMMNPLRLFTKSQMYLSLYARDMRVNNC